ncbi:MAG: hypothetical protein U0V04_03635 [Spirosomataceae bacterium]|jgi:hypothetical protein
MESVDLSLISNEDFAELLNKEFRIQFEENVILDSELIEITVFKNYSPLTRSPFSLIFRTFQKEKYYPQGVFNIIHPTLGVLSVFMVPKGFDSEGMRYEVVFS